MGLVSLVVEYNSIIIVGMDTFCCKGHEAIQKLLTAHIERLRARSELKEAWFIFLPEANLGHEADHMEYMLRNYRKIWTIRDKQRTGVVTTNTRKELYAMETVKYMTQESIYLWEHLVVANPAGTVREEARTLEEFKKQLMGFKRVICHPQRGYSLPKVRYLLFLSTQNLTNTSLPPEDCLYWKVTGGQRRSGHDASHRYLLAYGILMPKGSGT